MPQTRAGRPLRITENTRLILRVLADASAPMWGLDITKKSGLRHGTGHPVLVRLVQHGWVERTIEAKGTYHGRPARHFYELTPDGRLQADALFKEN